MLITKFNTFLHRHGKTMFAVLLVLLIFPFVLWGTFNPGAKQKARKAGTIFGEEVTDREYREAFARAYAEYVMMTGQADSRKAEKLLREQVWRTMALLREADRLGIEASRQDAERQLARYPVLSTNGNLDPRKVNGLVNQVLSRWQLNADDLLEIARNNVRIARLQELVRSSVHVTPDELRDAYDRRNEEYRVALATFSIEKLDPETTEIPEEELQAFFEENLARFRIPEKMTVRYVRFGPEEARAAGILDITDEELRKRYEAAPEDYADDEGNPPPFEEVKDFVRAEIESRRTRRWGSEKTSQLIFDLLTEEGEPVTNFEAVVEGLGGRPRVSELFSQGRTPSDLPASPGLAGEISSLTAEHPYSNPILIGDAHYVLAIGEDIPARDPDLEEVRDKVVQAFLQEKARNTALTRAQEAAETIRAAVRDGAAMEEAFHKAGVEPVIPEPFSRQHRPQETPVNPAILIDTASTLEQDEVSDPVPDFKGFTIVGLISRMPPSDEDFEKDRDLFRQEYLAQKRQMATRDWFFSLLDAADIQPEPGFGAPADEKG